MKERLLREYVARMLNELDLKKPSFDLDALLLDPEAAAALADELESLGSDQKCSPAYHEDLKNDPDVWQRLPHRGSTDPASEYRDCPDCGTTMKKQLREARHQKIGGPGKQESVAVPSVLYHVSSELNEDLILTNGLKPRGDHNLYDDPRVFVSSDLDAAVDMYEWSGHAGGPESGMFWTPSPIPASALRLLGHMWDQ